MQSVSTVAGICAALVCRLATYTCRCVQLKFGIWAWDEKKSPSYRHFREGCKVRCCCAAAELRTLRAL